LWTASRRSATASSTQWSSSGPRLAGSAEHQGHGQVKPGC
jgi:hypothetical protein